MFNVKDSVITRRWPAIFFLILTALILFYLKIITVLQDPFFPGDSGTRIVEAGNITVIAGNRVWLPFLQMHIWLFYKLGFPYWAFKLIPAFYFLIAVMFLGLLTIKILNKIPYGFLFSLFLMICFAFQPGIDFVSGNLYQEILEMAFFYTLLYFGVLNLKKSWFVLILAIFSLITRDTFFAYLFILTFFNFRKIIADRGLMAAFICLWLIPIAWFGAYVGGSLIYVKHFPQWPWMLNKTIVPVSEPYVSWQSLWASMRDNKVVFLMGTLMIGFPFIMFSGKTGRDKAKLSGDSEFDFKVFSLFSLTVIYSIYLIFDLWQITYGNMRMTMPLLAHLFIWSGIFFKETLKCPVVLRIVLRLMLIVSLIFMICPEVFKSRVYDADTSNYCHMIGNLRKNLLNTTPQLKACIVGNDYWDSLKLFIAPTMYMTREFIKPQGTNHFEGDNVVIAPSDFKLKDLTFLKYEDFKLQGELFSIYIKR